MTLECLLEGMLERAVDKALERRLKPQTIPAELLTIKDAAVAASVSEATVRQWLKDSILRRYGTGRTVRVRRDELLSLTPKMENSERTGEDIAAALLGKMR